MTPFLLLVGSYLLGAVPVGLIIAYLAARIDVREYGSHNIGASNVWRTLKTVRGPVWGPVWGTVTFLLDVAKGATPVIVARHVAAHIAWLPVAAGLLAIAGHNVSIFLRFKGGKGVATSLGVAAGLSWPAALIGFAVWLVVLSITRFISVASVVSTPIAAFFLWKFGHREWPYGLFAILATLFVIIRHSANIGRLRAGTEPRVGRTKHA